ncbi:BatD family protein [Cocleimonas flava]|uniref:Oxygen tolerance protein BatD n=1 Tax=Cocleimonas flava TaxID=634765 RepID=A0A4R1F803_9GAMM|nr:BatD family protein [Cocleimonas flava]TCJ88842.1 oxygen tolerance protein BatD [Cocleimonas flava]
MKFQISITSLLLALMMLVNLPAQAAVKASLNQSSVFEGDQITLSIQSDQNNDAQPDLSILQKDFEVQGSSTSSQINIINGNRSFRKTWTIELMPKAVGKLTIPEITVGADKTDPLTVTIANLPPEVAAETSKHIFVESSVDLDNKETYVQQQIPYTVKLYYDSAMQTGEVFSPQIENANIRALGNDKKYQVVRAGKKYVVVEKRFVISPEKSGVLHIPPTIVRGRIALSGGDSPNLRKRMDETDMLNQFFGGQNRNPFFNTPFDEFFGRRSLGPSRPFSISGEAIDVNVLPVPSSFKGDAWLPAEELLMTDSWAESPPELKVGEPVTRKLILQVKGLASSQIPDINISKPVGMKVYTDQAKSETPNDGNTIYGIRQIDINYIPGKAGKVTIPEINVDWWDVKNKVKKTFTLPEWDLTVAGNPAAVSENSNSAETSAGINAETTENETEQNITGQTDATETPEIWGWKTLVLLLLALMAILFVVFGFKKRTSKAKSLEAEPKKAVQLVDVEALKTSLTEACRSNDKHMAARLLLKLVRAQWNDQSIQNLGILAQALGKGREVIEALEKSLYSADSSDWDGSELDKLVIEGLYRKPVPLPQKQNGLKPLYPA